MKTKSLLVSQARRRNELYSLLGDLPPRNRKIRGTLVSREERPGHVLEKLTLDLNGIEPVPAYFVYPASGNGPWPTVLFNHSHGGAYHVGKEEFTRGCAYLQNPPYAETLTAAGYAGLSIDHWAFGERRGRTESAIFKEMLWRGRVMWGMMVYDSLRAVDYLVARPEVDAKRLGTLGISMGSTMAWWVAALDPRVQVCVDICCLTDFEDLIAINGLDFHGIYYYVPRLLRHFQTVDINALIAPRAHLALAGDYDGLTPLKGLLRIDRQLRRAYSAAGASDAWQLKRYPCGHMETAAMRVEIMQFLQKWL